MASTNGYETKTSSLLTAAGSPLNAASTSVCKISRTRGRLPRNSTVNLCASPVMSFLARPSGGLYSRLLRISSSSFPRIESSNAAVSILISDECINFSSKKPGNSSRNKSCVSAVTTRLDGRFFPSRWLMPPSCAYEATSWLVSCVTVSTTKDLPQRNQETKILSGTGPPVALANPAGQLPGDSGNATDGAGRLVSRRGVCVGFGGGDDE